MWDVRCVRFQFVGARFASMIIDAKKIRNCMAHELDAKRADD
jgi:hypothetical protein